MNQKLIKTIVYVMIICLVLSSLLTGVAFFL
ncbi:MAG: stressosome-associated protein Prli42 [Bacillota bacterium]|nr:MULTISPECIES: stressosome-associated protein Prli42 [Bacillaceae]MBH0157574.1 stressosome-associated protein Prli42 [Fictibacillus sp. 5RED26]MBH0160194.1 stressosome-associated protein Prli42 [Fictibacillus sp. 26RED30]MBH0166485.1 stressosome-associated protein Prli42 [Fictibacillus sp. 7GRE50]MBH0174505.1 stressosome-associated protein Prli42 [Fictibacillus sp. 23RED33]MED1863551.1 stressosome-associated protein Prli42 [Fictibacillus nanhaiensis]